MISGRIWLTGAGVELHSENKVRTAYKTWFRPKVIRTTQLLRPQHSLGGNIYLTHNSGVPGLQAFFSPWMEQFCDWQMNIYKHHSRAALKCVLKICSFFFPPVLWGIFQCLHILASIRASPVAPVTWFGTNGAIKHLSREWETGSTGNCVKTPCGI